MPPQGFPWVYQYVEEGRGSSSRFVAHPHLRPVVSVRLLGSRPGSQNVAALVDSGCDHVLAAPWIAQDIGVIPDSNRESVLGIGGGSQRVRFADVSIHLLPPAVSVTSGGSTLVAYMSGRRKSGCKALLASQHLPHAGLPIGVAVTEPKGSSGAHMAKNPNDSQPAVPTNPPGFRPKE